MSESRSRGLFKFHRSTVAVNFSCKPLELRVLCDSFGWLLPLSKANRGLRLDEHAQLKTRCTTNSGIRIWWQIQNILDSPSLWVILFLSTNRSLAESSRVHCGLYIVQIYFNFFILTISSSAGEEATFSRQTLVPLLQSTGYLLLTIPSRRWRWTF